MADGKIRLNVDLGQALQQLQRLNTSLEGVDSQAQSTNRKLTGLSTSMKAQTVHLRELRSGLGKLLGEYRSQSLTQAKIHGQLRQLNTSYIEQTRAVNEQTAAINRLVNQYEQLSRAKQRVNQQMKDTRQELTALSINFLSLAAIVGTMKKSLDISIELDSLTKTFFAITGSMSGAAMEMQYLREMSQNLGLDFMALTKSYKGFSAATKYANMDMATSKEIFEAVSEASTVLGLSGEKTQLVLMALEQMVSKGVVSMEELRRQLGDSLPGAFELGAKAMGMTLQEFNKFVASGQLMTDEFLPKFARTLRETYATVENVGLAVKTPRAEIQKLMNELTFAMDAFARYGFLETVKNGVIELREALQDPSVRDSIIQLGKFFGMFVEQFLKLIQLAIEYSDTMRFLALTYISVKAALIGYNQVVRIQSALQAEVKARTDATTFSTNRFSASLQRVKITAQAAGAAWKSFLVATGFGIVAALVTELALNLSETGENFDHAGELAQKFGVSVDEARVQLEAFLRVADKGAVDPLKKFKESIESINVRIKDMSITAGTSLSTIQENWDANRLSAERYAEVLNQITDTDWDAIDITGLVSDVGSFNSESMKENLSRELDFAKRAINGFFEQLRQGAFSSKNEIMSALGVLRTGLEENAGSVSEAWKQAFDVLLVNGMATGDLIEQRLAVMQQLNLESVNNTWLDFNMLTQEAIDNLRVMTKVSGDMKLSFGTDFDRDSKQVEAWIKLIEKYYGKSEEGIKKANAASKAAISNATLVGQMWLQIETQRIESNRRITQDQIDSTKERIRALMAEMAVQVQAGNLREAAYTFSQMTAAQGNLSAYGSRMGAYAKQFEAAQKRAMEIAEQGKAALEAFNKEQDRKTNGGRTGSANAGRRDQTYLQNFEKAVSDSTNAIEQLQSREAQLRAQLQGDSFAAQLEKISSNAAAQIHKLDTTVTNLQNKLAAMNPGAQRDAAQEQLDILKGQVDEQKKLIEGNKELEQQIVRIKREMAKLKNDSERSRRAGDFQAMHQSEVERLKLQLGQTGVDDPNRAALEYELAREQATATMDFLWYMQDGIHKWAIDIQLDMLETFGSIIPDALNNTVDAFTTMFTDIITGSSSAKDAWSAFTQAITNMGKMIIRQLIQIAVQMMVVKTISSIGGLFGFAKGGTADLNGTVSQASNSISFGSGYVAGATSVDKAANGRVIGGGGRIIPFASGGILTGPHLFGTKGGDTVLAGEAGPEAFVPLGRTKSGKLGVEVAGSGISGGGNVIMLVNINNNASDKVEARAQQGTDSNGNPRLDVFIDTIDAMIGQKIKQGTSQVGAAIDKTRGTSTTRNLFI